MHWEHSVRIFTSHRAPHSSTACTCPQKIIVTLFLSSSIQPERRGRTRAPISQGLLIDLGDTLTKRSLETKPKPCLANLDRALVRYRDRSWIDSTTDDQRPTTRTTKRTTREGSNTHLFPNLAHHSRSQKLISLAVAIVSTHTQ